MRLNHLMNRLSYKGMKLIAASLVFIIVLSTALVFFLKQDKPASFDSLVSNIKLAIDKGDYSLFQDTISSSFKAELDKDWTTKSQQDFYQTYLKTLKVESISVEGQGSENPQLNLMLSFPNIEKFAPSIQKQLEVNTALVESLKTQTKDQRVQSLNLFFQEELSRQTSEDSGLYVLPLVLERKHFWSSPEYVIGNGSEQVNDFKSLFNQDPQAMYKEAWQAGDTLLSKLDAEDLIKAQATSTSDQKVEESSKTNTTEPSKTLNNTESSSLITEKENTNTDGAQAATSTSALETTVTTVTNTTNDVANQTVATEATETTQAEVVEETDYFIPDIPEN